MNILDLCRKRNGELPFRVRKDYWSQTNNLNILVTRVDVNEYGYPVAYGTVFYGNTPARFCPHLVDGHTGIIKTCGCDHWEFFIRDNEK